MSYKHERLEEEEDEEEKEEIELEPLAKEGESSPTEPGYDSAGEDTEGHSLLLKEDGGVSVSAVVLFELDTLKYRYTRRCLLSSALLLMLGLLAAAIAMIAISPACPGAAPSTDLLWWQSGIIYQCYPRSFQDSNGSGNGDLNGIRSRLDYFEEIGIRAVWLNPIYPSPHMDNGYDIKNYTDIDSMYGNLSVFKSLLEDMHERGLKLILDFVPNHSSEDHPWFKESRSSRDSPKRDWYIWADGGKGEGPPNNWISVFGGSAWTYDNLTDQYYLHQYGSFQPDLNYTNSEVQEAMKDVLKFWLDLGVDGFRVDAVSHLLEDAKLRNETRNPAFTGKCTTNISSPDCYHSLIHNLTTNYDGVHEVVRSWRLFLDSYSTPGNERFMVGEVYDTLNGVVSYYGKDNDEFNFPFNFILLKNTNWTGSHVSELVGEWLDRVPEGAWSNWVLGTHDNPRIASRAGVNLARALNMLLLTLPGTPTTYYGEEILMTDYYDAIDISDEERDKERTPMQWDTTCNAGFTSPTSKPWLPIPTNHTTYNVQVETSDPHSSLSLYKKLTEIRSNYSALQSSGYRHIHNCSDAHDSTDVYSYLRSDPASNEELLVVINFSPEEKVVDIGGCGLFENPFILLSSNLNRTGGIDLSGVELRGGEALIIGGG